MSSDLDKDQRARLGPQVRPSPEVPHLPGLHLVGYFFAFVGGAMGVLNAGPPSKYFLDLFLIWVLPCLLLAVFGGTKFFREMWITNWKPVLRERGIVLRRASRAKAFGFNEVKRIAIRERDIFESREFYARQWDVTLWSEKDNVTFRLRTLDGHRDEAGEFLDDLRAALAEVAGRRLRRGEALAGTTWRLTDAGFKSGALEVPFEEIAGAGLFGGGRVGLWKLGEERPFFTISARSPNVPVLYDVLASRLPAHELGLGRLQFEKRAHLLPATLAFLPAAASIVSAVRLANEGDLSPALSLGGFGVFLLGVTYLLLARGFRCYERGLMKYDAFGRKEIQFAEVGGITLSPWELRFKGIYLIRNLTLTLHRRQGGEPFQVSHLMRRASDRDIEGLLDRLAEGLADEAREILERDGELPWGNGVWFTRHGLRYDTAKGNGQADTNYVHYPQGILYKFDQGELFLYKKGDNRSIAQVPTNLPNFFVGLALLERLAGEATGARTARDSG